MHTLAPYRTQYTQRVNPVSSIGSLTARSSGSLDYRRKVPAERLASDPSATRLAKYAANRRASTKLAPTSTDPSKLESDEGKVAAP